MKIENLFLVLFFLQTGCAVEIRDRHQQESTPVFPQQLSEIRVDKEYALVIPPNQPGQKVVKLDRLILGREGQIITQGADVRIEIKELISEGGVIRTFKPEQTASPEMDGRSGGRIELIVDHAEGDLQIVMQGERGGRGGKGLAPDEALRGTKGARGEPPVYDSRPAEGIILYQCVKKASNGAAGGPGLQGYPGRDGRKGGDSGTAFIKISANENFSLKIQKTPGLGGEGGEGGAGGPGGFGGEPGAQKPDEPCPWITTEGKYPKAGPEGPQGPQGRSGYPGISGETKEVCTQISEEGPRCE